MGWYDDRDDPFNTKVEYFVAKSINAGSTFPKQQAVNDTSFNPSVGFPFCGFFGNAIQDGSVDQQRGQKYFLLPGCCAILVPYFNTILLRHFDKRGGKDAT